MPASSKPLKKTSRRRKKAVLSRKVFVVATNSDYAKLCRNSVTRLGGESKATVSLVGFDALSSGKNRPRSGAQTVFVSRLADISEVSAKRTKSVPGAKYLLFPEGMPVESLISRLSLLDVRNEQRLHVAHEQEVDQIGQVIYRMLRGVAQAEGAKPIVDAWIENESLVVLSPTFERLTVPLGKLKPSLGDDDSSVRDFEIDEDGSFLYWEHADAHLGWEQLLQLVNPHAALAAMQRTKAFHRRYGAAIKTLREERGISQSAIEGLTDRHLRRIEQGQQAATKASLDALAHAHRMELNEYLEEVAKRLT